VVDYTVGNACWNVWTLTLRVLTFGSREEDSNVVFERLWIPFFIEFVKADYRIGDVGYITARTLRANNRLTTTRCAG
jgi:hypothetical protein